MKAQDHIAAHVNGLRSSIHAVEVQMTILKQLLGKPADAEETEIDEEETPKPKKARKAKAVEEDEVEVEEVEDEDVSEDDDSDSDEEDAEDDSEDESDSDGLSEGDLGKLKTALKAYALKKGKAKAVAILNKFAETSKDVKPTDLPKLLKMLKL